MGEIIVLVIIAVIAITAGGLFAHHMDMVRTQAWLDKKIIIAKWVKYTRIKNGSSEFISTIEDLNEAEQDLRKTAAWYNKKYKLYGYCCPPELLFDLED